MGQALAVAGLFNNIEELPTNSLLECIDGGRVLKAQVATLLHFGSEFRVPRPVICDARLLPLFSSLFHLAASTL
jgi:hypothetical protein